MTRHDMIQNKMCQRVLTPLSSNFQVHLGSQKNVDIFLFTFQDLSIDALLA